jgi:hypothetical protein
VNSSIELRIVLKILQQSCRIFIDWRKNELWTAVCLI